MEAEEKKQKLEKNLLKALYIGSILALGLISFYIMTGFSRKDSIYFQGRAYRKSNFVSKTRAEIEDYFKVEIERKGTAVGTGEIWGSKDGCVVTPCTSTVLFVKVGEDKFQDYALQGGP
jgi:hypothetical protein